MKALVFSTSARRVSITMLPALDKPPPMAITSGAKIIIRELRPMTTS